MPPQAIPVPRVWKTPMQRLLCRAPRRATRPVKVEEESRKRAREAYTLVGLLFFSMASACLLSATFPFCPRLRPASRVGLEHGSLGGFGRNAPRKVHVVVRMTRFGLDFIQDASRRDASFSL